MHKSKQEIIITLDKYNLHGTALLLAAICKNEKVVESLLEKGANVDIQNNNKCNIFDILSQSNRTKGFFSGVFSYIVKYLYSTNPDTAENIIVNMIKSSKLNTLPLITTTVKEQCKSNADEMRNFKVKLLESLSAQSVVTEPVVEHLNSLQIE